MLGPPFIRFYAGAQLELPGQATAGTLCVIDTQPRQLERTDLAILGSLRDLVVQELVSQPVPP